MKTDQEAIGQAEEWYAECYSASAHGHVQVDEHGNAARTASWLWIDLVPKREEAEVITVAIAVRGEMVPVLVGEGLRCPRCPLGEQKPWRPNAEARDDGKQIAERTKRLSVGAAATASLLPTAFPGVPSRSTTPLPHRLQRQGHW